jgi:LmbE family N-acetylglucosaminyl deacetylase
MAVDGSHYNGLESETSYEQRIREIEVVTSLLGCTYDVAYGNRGLMEKLDTLPKRELVDLFEDTINEHRPDLLLLPYGVDYDQDHVATFETAFAASRPVPEAFGKYMVPHILTCQMTKITWAVEALPRPVAYCDISSYLEAKLDAMKCYATQFRPSPHVRSLEAISALALIRGKEIGIEYAEAFGILRTVI